MNAEGGYTRQYRRLWDNPVFRNKQEAAVFSWLKDAAAWRPTTVRTRFGPIPLEVGEVLVTERQVAEDFGIDRKRLRCLMQRMVEAGMIALSGSTVGTANGTSGRTSHGTSAGTIVTILKYVEYQGLRVVHPAPEEPVPGPVPEPQTGPQTGPLYIKKERKKESTLDPNGSNGAGAPPPPDPADLVKQMWARGVALLGESSRSLIGKARREYGDLIVIDVLIECYREQPVAPVEYFIGCLKQRGGNGHGKLSPMGKFWAGGQQLIEEWDREEGDFGPYRALDVPLLDGRRSH